MMKKYFFIAAGFTAFQVIPALGLHFDRQALSFSTIEELYTPGKEIKAWSDTSIVITSVLFKYRENISWQYKANAKMPCTLSVGDTCGVSVYAGSVRDIDVPLVDTLVVVTKSLVNNSVPLKVAAIPHLWVTTKTLSGPVSDSAGKSLRYSRDSVSCTYRHTITHTFLWDDGFQAKLGTGVRAAFHSWSFSGTYNVRCVASCWGNLAPDTTPAYQVTILPADIQAKGGAYKSGFFVFTGGTLSQQIDFSQPGVASQEADVRFVGNSGYNVVAPYGIINLGAYDSLPIIATMGLGGFVPETSSVCRTYKPVYDSIVTSLRLVGPAGMTDTATRIVTKQACLVRTKEGHGAVMIRVGEWIGAAVRDYYYWGYQSDGARMLVPGVASGVKNEPPRQKPGATSRVKIKAYGTILRLSLPKGAAAKELSVYSCDGSRLYRRRTINLESGWVVVAPLAKGTYLVSVRSDRETVRQRVWVY